MTATRTLILAAVAAALLSGCSTLNSLTGQTDNTVLPGTREEAIPGRAQFPDTQDVAVGTPGAAAKAATAPEGSTESKCAPKDPKCKPPGSSGDTFKDPQ